MSAPRSLDAFLRSRKAGARTAKYWCTGNESGDLDSLACAIAFSFLSTAVSPKAPEWVPVLQTARRDLRLRPENELALARLGIAPESLCCVDELPRLGADANVALVDHNQATGPFAAATVRAVLDHHADTGAYAESDPRVVYSPDDAGSCSSVLTRFFRAQLPDGMPQPVADLLLSAIEIDTLDFSEKAGRAKQIDHDARDYLLPHSSFAKGDSLSAYFAELFHAKNQVSHLTTPELLRRDYKEFTQAGADGKAHPWRIGVASLTLSLAEWVQRGAESVRSDLDAFAAERSLDAVVALAGFEDEAGRPRRQLLFYAPQRASGAHKIAEGLEQHRGDRVDLERLELPVVGERHGSVCVAWEQRDAGATRKQFAPALQTVCANVLRS